MRLGRPRFGDLIRRQLDLFEREHRGLIEDCLEAERAYVSAPRDEAEERYGDYMDLVEEAEEELLALRAKGILMLRENGFATVRAEGTRRLYAVEAAPLPAFRPATEGGTAGR